MSERRTSKTPAIDDPAGGVDPYENFRYCFALSRVKESSLPEDLDKKGKGR
jgi:hypothetical protein